MSEDAPGVSPTTLQERIDRGDPVRALDLRNRDEVDRWRERDPISRMEAFLRDRDLLNDGRIDAIEARNRERIADLIEAAEAYEPDVDDWFEHAYAEQTPRVREAREYVRDLRERHGDDALLRDE